MKCERLWHVLAMPDQHTKQCLRLVESHQRRDKLFSSPVSHDLCTLLGINHMTLRCSNTPVAATALTGDAQIDESTKAQGRQTLQRELHRFQENGIKVLETKEVHSNLALVSGSTNPVVEEKFERIVRVWECAVVQVNQGAKKRKFLCSALELQSRLEAFIRSSVQGDAKEEQVVDYSFEKIKLIGSDGKTNPVKAWKYSEAMLFYCRPNHYEAGEEVTIRQNLNKLGNTLLKKVGVDASDWINMAIGDVIVVNGFASYV